jgi:hypothetical protein
VPDTAPLPRVRLDAGVPATQVAEWAGHSVAVLLRVYAKCIAGQEDSAQQRVDVALNSSTNSPQTPVDDRTAPDTAGSHEKASDQ